MKTQKIQKPYNLYDEDGTLFTDVYFTNVGQAEARLIEHDARGNIK